MILRLEQSDVLQATLIPGDREPFRALQKPSTFPNPPMPLRCLIVEDQLMFLQMLERMLHSIPGIGVVTIAQSEAAGIRACEEHLPDLLLLDLALPDGDGLRVARHLARVNPSAKVIILSGEASTFICPAALNHQIHAVLDKTQAFEDLTSELRSLIPREKASLAYRGSRGPSELLSGRELEIFRLIGLGISTKEIGDKLSISPHTVQAHRKRIAAKLGTAGNELLQAAVLYQAEMKGAGGR